MGKIARKMVMTVAGTVASRTVRRITRGALHTRTGTPRLPRRARGKGGLAVSLAWIAGAAAAMALADVCAEQARAAARLG